MLFYVYQGCCAHKDGPSERTTGNNESNLPSTPRAVRGRVAPPQLHAIVVLKGAYVKSELLCLSRGRCALDFCFMLVLQGGKQEE